MEWTNQKPEQTKEERVDGKVKSASRLGLDRLREPHLYLRFISLSSASWSGVREGVGKEDRMIDGVGITGKTQENGRQTYR